MTKSAVIREVAAATEGPLNCKLRYHLMEGAHYRCEVPRFARDDMPQI
jgi:hypothetical protein